MRRGPDATGRRGEQAFRTVRIVCVGGGPAGLYFAILMKRSHPDHEIVVLERNRPGDTYGFGVVFSDATLEELAAADHESYEAITESFYHWDDIDIHYRGERLTSTGHGFSGLARAALLEILEARARALGVELRHGVEVASEEPCAGADLVLAADGVNSAMRARYADAFGPRIDLRPNRFVWLGTTKPFPAFTFHFRETEHGLWRVHAYQYRSAAPAPEAISTFIVEATNATWRAAGLDTASERETARFLEEVFAEELGSHRLIRNRSIWRGFPTVRNRAWRHGNIVLVGDAAHSAHFSIGSGTRLAMIDSISLHESLLAHDLEVAPALEAYETARRPEVESVQRAAQASLEWFEGTERFMETEPLQFAFNLITRSLRITHSNLAVRDPEFTARVDRRFADRAAAAGTSPVESDPAPPPLLAPFRLRGLELKNRVVVSAMCQYSAEDGTPDDWHLVNLGSRAIGGAGLVMSEMTDVSRAGRISLGCTGMYETAHVRAWEADRRLRAPPLRRRDRHAARARGPEGVHPALLGRRQRAAGGGRVADHGRVARPLVRAQPRAPRDDARRHGSGDRPVPPRRGDVPRRRASTCWRSTSRMDTCWRASSPPSRTFGRTNTGETWTDGCGSRSKCWPPCGACGRRRSRSRYGFRRSTGRRAG